MDWTDKVTGAYCRLLEMLLVVLLVAMVLMVFGNVVLRYGFNSGITFSEELSRWAFVWMTFLGAIVALKDNGHLGTDMLVGRVGPTGKKVCLAIADPVRQLVAGEDWPRRRSPGDRLVDGMAARCGRRLRSVGRAVPSVEAWQAAQRPPARR